MPGSATMVSLGDWTFEPQILLSVLVLAILYWRGTAVTRVLLPPRHRYRRRAWQSASFYAALILGIVALESPLERMSRSFMWAHMVQHLLLIMVVAPLALLGDPVMPLLRGIPLQPRRRMLAMLLRQHWLYVLAASLDRISRPKPAFIIFAATFYGWHIVPFYNATLDNQAIHDAEHVSFVVASLLLWWQVIDQTSVRLHLSYFWRAAFMFIAAIENHILALVLSLSTVPFYAYKNLDRPAGTISALTDQQLAGGIMWVPGMLLFGGAFAIFFYKWLRAQSANYVEPRLNLSPTGQVLPFDQPA